MIITQLADTSTVSTNSHFRVKGRSQSKLIQCARCCVIPAPKQLERTYRLARLIYRHADTKTRRMNSSRTDRVMGNTSTKINTDRKHSTQRKHTAQNVSTELVFFVFFLFLQHTGTRPLFILDSSNHNLKSANRIYFATLIHAIVSIGLNGHITPYDLPMNYLISNPDFDIISRVLASETNIHSYISMVDQKPPCMMRFSTWNSYTSCTQEHLIHTASCKLTSLQLLTPRYRPDSNSQLSK